MNWESERLIWKNKIKSRTFDFEEMALKLFYFQYQINGVYKAYADLIKRTPESVKDIHEIPFLPIHFFKEFQIKTGNFVSEVTFKSSGTSHAARSQHEIRDLDWYHWVSAACFDQAYTPYIHKDFNHLGYLPSYAANPHSSLLSMINFFIRESEGGYYHDRPELIINKVEEKKGKRCLLWGVSYALYQWQGHQEWLDKCTIIETGGMKGHEREMTREELHEKIKLNFGVGLVHSEYGMSELLSQSYSMGSGLFSPSFTTKILPRCINDPLSIEKNNQTAALNIIDLANMDSCAFIATDDIGKKYDSDTFIVTGRLDNSDIRGCNLLV
ncbi:MAG: acyl transferase [Saprospiraceae bacterium]